MSTRSTNWLGVATIWPVLYIPVMILGIRWIQPYKRSLGMMPPPDVMPWWLILALLLHAATMVLGIAITVAYVIYVFRRPLPQKSRALWATLLILGNIISIVPFYWLHVRPDGRRPRACVNAR
jgi:hypothetical protein